MGEMRIEVPDDALYDAKRYREAAWFKASATNQMVPQNFFTVVYEGDETHTPPLINNAGGLLAKTSQ